MDAQSDTAAFGRRSFLAGALTLAGGAAAIPKPLFAATAPKLAAARAAEIDRIARAALLDKKTPGLMVAVAYDGAVDFARGYGFANLDYNLPVTRDTVFRVGSITKQFTAASVLLLAERGKLSLDDPYSKYFPEFPDSDRFTIRHLLTHTSGLKNYTSIPEFRDYMRVDRSTLDMMAYIARLRPRFDFEPGARWSYSNSGYYLAGAVVEKLSGQSFAQFLQENISRKQGLANTVIDQDGDIVARRASGYDPAPTSATGFNNAFFAVQSVAGPAGALRSTADDLLAWHHKLLGGQVLQPESLKQMITPARLKNGQPTSTEQVHPPSYQGKKPTEYGLGLFLEDFDGHAAISHGGAISGFNAMIATFPDSGVSLAILCNCGGAATTLYPAMARAVLGLAALPS